jgi:hypothetical protein
VILESLSEPLTHLLRNSVIHGIEPPGEREQAGKPACGRIELRAVPRGGLVEITVSDDGRGVSPEIVEEARQEGSLADVLSRAGFSTAGEVTDLAGRGVGLDAVKTHVHSLGGRFDVTSEPGHGMAVSLLLPVALALLKVLLIQRGGAVYGLPIAGDTPRPSSETVISTRPPRGTARSSMRPQAGLPACSRSPGGSIPWITELRSRWVSGSDRLSRITRSSSVSAPTTVNSTSRPIDRARSRMARGSGPVIIETGRVRIPTAESFSSSSIRSPALSSSAASVGSPSAAPSA